MGGWKCCRVVATASFNCANRNGNSSGNRAKNCAAVVVVTLFVSSAFRLLPIALWNMPREPRHKRVVTTANTIMLEFRTAHDGDWKPTIDACSAAEMYFSNAAASDASWYSSFRMFSACTRQRSWTPPVAGPVEYSYPSTHRSQDQPTDQQQQTTFPRIIDTTTTCSTHLMSAEHAQTCLE